ncbi:MAG TPA: hypothetical protein VN132_04765 [Bdellovibrio sp.]|nr:hypothetical protein [Bdellovibrio sp.]
MNKKIKGFLGALLSLQLTLASSTVFADINDMEKKLNQSELKTQKDELGKALADVQLQMKVLEDIADESLLGKYKAYAEEFHSRAGWTGLITGSLGMLVLPLLAQNQSERNIYTFTSFIVWVFGALNLSADFVHNYFFKHYAKYRASFDEYSTEEKLLTYKELCQQQQTILENIQAMNAR